MIRTFKIRLAGKVVLLLLSGAEYALAQGSAEIAVSAFQSHLSGIPDHTDTGLSGAFSQLIPGFGLLAGSFDGADESSAIRRGQSYLQISDVHSPWGMASLAVGDSELVLNRVFVESLPGYYLPALSLTGISSSVTRAGNSFELFSGSEYSLAGPQITERLGTKRLVNGFTSSWRVGTKLVLGSRALDLSNADSANNWFVSNPSYSIKRSVSLANQISWTPISSTRVFAEIERSWSRYRQTAQPANRQHFSSLLGGAWKLPQVELTGTYLSQAVDYLPLANSYLGSRRGIVTEFHLRPTAQVDIYGSLSDLTSIISVSPMVTQKSTIDSVGFSTFLGKTSLSGNFTELSSHSSPTPSTGEVKSNQLANLNLTRQQGRQTIRLILEELSIKTSADNTRQHVLEVEDGIRVRRLNFGTSIRFEREFTPSQRDQMAARVFWNYSWRFLSTHGSFEAGSDLANRSLLTKTGSQVATIGLIATLKRNWQLRADAYRSNSLISFNAQNIALLSQNGLAPATILNSNQWTTYVRVSHSLSWGGGESLAHVAQLARTSFSDTGTVQVFVRGLHGTRSDQGLAGIPVQLDRSRFALTDHSGQFRFVNVPAGQHLIGIDTWHLPAEYGEVSVTELTINVQPHHTSTPTFELHHMGSIKGQIVGLPQASSTIVELDSGDRITTPENDGSFIFDNVAEGDHQIGLRSASLPEDYHQTGTIRPQVQVGCGGQAEVQLSVVFAPKVKPVRTIHLNAQQ